MVFACLLTDALVLKSTVLDVVLPCWTIQSINSVLKGVHVILWGILFASPCLVLLRAQQGFQNECAHKIVKHGLTSHNVKRMEL